MGEFRMPSLGADMDAATLVEWKAKPGERVARGQIVAVIETDKGAIDVEMLEDGVIDALVVEPWTKVPVGTVLATWHAPSEPAPAPAPVSAPAPVPAPTPPAAPAPAAPRPLAAPPPVARVGAPAGPARSSPAARKRAEALGLDLAAIPGTGPGGAVVLSDVDRAAEAAKAPAAPTPTPEAPRPAAPVEPAAEAPRAAVTGIDPEAMRKAIATRMARSKREIPHYYLGVDVDLTASVAWLDAWNASHPVTERLVHAALLLKATALAAARYPEMNGHYGPDGFAAAEHVRLGVAISLRSGGLVVPAIEQAEAKTLVDLMCDLNALVERARSGRLRASDLSDPTLTVTNLGAQGVPFVLPVIFPPQVAMVGFGRVADRPCVVDGQVVARPMVTVTLAADHRVSDGHRGGLFLRALDRTLQHPEEL